MEELELEYVTLTLINGQVVISKMSAVLDKNDYYTMIAPLKPIILPESNKIALVQYNPFSESIEFQIHCTHVVTMGALDINYIQMYDTAVEALHIKAKRSYDEFIGVDDIDDIEDTISPTSKIIH